MANQDLGHEKQITDSYVDVVFASLRDADFVEGSFRVYDRLEELKAVSGEHYFRTGTCSAFSELVIGDILKIWLCRFPSDNYAKL